MRLCVLIYYACRFQQRVHFKAIDILRRDQIEQSSCVFGIALTLLSHLCESTNLKKKRIQGTQSKLHKNKIKENERKELNRRNKTHDKILQPHYKRDSQTNIPWDVWYRIKY